MQTHRLTLEIAGRTATILVRAVHVQTLIGGGFEYLDRRGRVACTIPPGVIASEMIPDPQTLPKAKAKANHQPQA